MSAQHRLHRILGHVQGTDRSSSSLFSGSIDLSPCAASGSASAAGRVSTPLFPDLKEIKAEQIGRVVVFTLYRPKALNALCNSMMQELCTAVNRVNDDKSRSVGCIIITGYGRAFAAGADIAAMANSSFADMLTGNCYAFWEQVAQSKIPTIAAINGFCLGGGCELAMMCDIMIASDKAKFGQPEINLGVIPGAGGTQRLTRAIGKSRAMEMILTGKLINAHEAERLGLVSCVIKSKAKSKGESKGKGKGKDAKPTPSAPAPAQTHSHTQTVEASAPYSDNPLMLHALKIGRTIASKSLPVAMLAKAAVNNAYEANLKSGLDAERKMFQSAFGLKDQKSGMRAFLQKKKAAWEHQ